MDVNALNYCRFSLVRLPHSPEVTEPRALLALPNLVESSVVRPYIITPYDMGSELLE